MVIWGLFPPLIFKTHAFVISVKTRKKTFIVKKLPGHALLHPAKDLSLSFKTEEYI